MQVQTKRKFQLLADAVDDDGKPYIASVKEQSSTSSNMG